VNDDDERMREERRLGNGAERSNLAAGPSSESGAIDYRAVLPGCVAGLCGGVALIVVQMIASGIVETLFPPPRRAGFPSPVDLPGSLSYFFVQATALVAAVAMLVFAIRLARRMPGVAAGLFVAALTLAYPATACTIDAWTNLRNALAPYLTGVHT
jgi:hypothetical protein